MRDRNFIAVGSFRWLYLLIGICGALFPFQADAQEISHSVILQNVPLDDVLVRLAESAGINLIYDDELVQGVSVYCVDRPTEINELLWCVLRDTGLDYVINSSGTYIIIRAVQEAPAYGRLQGIVLDSESGRPLPYANVLLADAGLGVAANDGGLFSLSALEPGDYHIRLSFIGYKTRSDSIRIKPGAVTQTTFELEPETVTVTPILITGFQHRMPSHRLGHAEHAPLDDLPSERSFAARNWMDATGSSLGFSLHEPWADLHIQGGASGEHQTFLDGIPIRNTVALGRLLGAFSPLALESITVHKAGFNARHGSALSGSIHMDHALYRADQHVGAVQIDPLSLNLRGQHRFETRGGATADIMVAGRTSLWNLAKDPQTNRMLDDWHLIDPYLTPFRYLDTFPYWTAPHENEVSFYDLHSAGRFRWNPFHSISATFYRGSGEVEARRLFWTDNNDVSHPYSRDQYSHETTAGRLQYQGFFSSALLGSLSVYRVHQSFGHGYTMPYVLRPGASPPPDGGDLKAFDRNELTETAAEILLEANPARRHQLTASLTVAHIDSRIGIDNEFFREVDYQPSQFRISGLLQDDIQLSTRTQLELGLRYSFISGHDELYAEPRISLRYDGHSARFGDYAFRLASGAYRQFTHELDFSSSGPMGVLPFVRFWIPAGSDLGPSLAYHLAADALWHPTETLTFEVETYYKWQPRRVTIDFRELAKLHQTIIDMIPDESFMTVASGESFGVDLRARYSLSRMNAAVGYGFMHAIQRIPDQFDGIAQPVPWEQPHRLSVDVDWAFTPTWSVFAHGKGIWGRSWAYRRAYYEYLEPLVQLDIPGLIPVDVTNPGGDRLDPFYQLDLGLAFSHRVGAARIHSNIKVMNVLNRRNELDRTVIELDEGHGVISRVHPGRMVTVGIRLEF